MIMWLFIRNIQIERKNIMEKNEILMIYGKNYKEMTKEILTSAKLAEQIGDKKKKIGLKPNLVVAKTPDSGATTHMEMIEGTIEYLQELSLKHIFMSTKASMEPAT